LVEFNEAVMSAPSTFRALSDDPSYAPISFVLTSWSFHSIAACRTRLRYEESKLLNNFFSQSLASLLSSTPVIVNAVHPGYCYSDIRRDVRGIAAAIHWLAEKIFAFTTEEGGRQIVWAVIGRSGDVDALRGSYMVATKLEEPADFLLGEKGKEREAKLWVSPSPFPESPRLLNTSG
jgi:NAD(P)-dependent dehydrogenase (short-subunit alcohol dehydrogenase family)